MKGLEYLIKLLICTFGGFIIGILLPLQILYWLGMALGYHD